MSSREERISENLGLVHSCARRFKGRGIEYDDLFQAGCVGLVKAVDHFEEERGLCFSTYAVPVILGEIRRLFRDGGTVKVGRTLKELSLKASRETANFTEREGRPPSVGELADILQVEPELAAQAICAGQQPLSLTADPEEGGGQVDVRAAFAEGGCSQSGGPRPQHHLLSLYQKQNSDGDCQRAWHDTGAGFPAGKGYFTQFKRTVDGVKR